MKEKAFESIIEKREEEPVDLDVLFVGSPVHYLPALEGKTIELGYPLGEIPNGLLHMATFLKENELSSRILPLDPFLRQEQRQSDTEADFFEQTIGILEKCIEKYQPKVLAFEMMYTFNSAEVLRIAHWCREKYPEKKIIVGGNHATFSAAEILQSGNGVDVIVRGEGEWTMAELTKELKKETPDLESIKGISYLEQADTVKNTSPRDRGDLYTLPPLDYELVDLPSGDKLAEFNHSVMFARACQGNCAFCTSPNFWNHEVTEKSVENFRQNLSYLLDNGVRHISLWDDDIMLMAEEPGENSFKKVMAVLKEIKADDRYQDVNFYAQARVGHFRNFDEPEKNARREEGLTLLKDAGVVKIFLGVESCSDKILGAMRKGTNFERIKQACQNVKAKDIEIGAFIIVGHPGSSVEEENASLEKLEELMAASLIDDMQCHILAPLPGAEVSTDERVRILETDPKLFGVINNDPVYELIDPKTGHVVFSREQIRASYDRYMDLRLKYLGLKPEESNRPRKD
jgi:radical SAM superfamily enzyme YgiQ (UPF0313 family)